MAHVFISYSSLHRPETKALAELLEGQGYAVWWDLALESWDSYQSQIDAAIAAASVVVVIWSPGAAASLYVKAEANKAKASGKLVCARLPGFPVSAIPSPYNAMHIDTLDLSEPHRLLRSIRGAWERKPDAAIKPDFELYRETYQVDLFDPKRTETVGDFASLAPSDLLQARREIVPFVDVSGLRAEMLSWCENSSRATAGRLVHGPGGFGKTRLMIEVAKQLRTRDWLAGFLPVPPTSVDRDREQKERRQALEHVFAFGDEPGVLVVIDYAEGREDEVSEIARLIAQRKESAARPVRLVLLSRGDAWWREYYERQSSDDVRKVFQLRGSEHGDVRLAGPVPEGQPRLDLLVATVTAFEPIMRAMAEDAAFPGWDGTSPSQERLIRLMTDKAYTRPLAIQMEAILYLASSSPEAGQRGIDALLSRVLSLERAHWAKVIGGTEEKKAGRLNDIRQRDLARGVAQVTAVQGVPSRDATERLLMADRFDTRRTDRASVDPVRRDLAKVYGRGDAIAHLEPDLVGEHQVVSAESGDKELIDGCLVWIDGEPEADRPKRRDALFTVLLRATRPEHGAAAERAVGLLAHIVRAQVAQAHAGLLPELIAAAAKTPSRWVELADGATLDAINGALPMFAVSLLEFSLSVARRRLDLAQKLVASADASAPPEAGTALQYNLANAFHTLGIRYSNLKRLDDALKASEEAVKIVRDLYKQKPDVFAEVLANSLNNISVDYSNLKRLDDALKASEEAVTIRRDLYRQKPDVFAEVLASSLNNLGMMHSNLKRLDDALKASEEAVTIFRDLYKQKPDVFAEVLASSLNNLGIRYSELKRLDDALKASQEAVTILRDLYRQKPDIFAADLAQSLGVMCMALRGLDRAADGAAATREGLMVLLPVLTARPAIHRDLAMVLHREHIEASEEAGQEPDTALLERVAQACGN